MQLIQTAVKLVTSMMPVLSSAAEPAQDLLIISPSSFFPMERWRRLTLQN
jgi:hypothetical protein